MRIEVGKKYRISGSDKPWEVVAIDGNGVAWGLVDGVMRHLFINVISEWQDKPDPGEGWRLLHSDEDLQSGDEIFLPDAHPFDDWNCVEAGNNRQTPKMFYRRRIAPQYVPYTWGDREELRGRWYRRKGDNCEFMVNYVTRYNENDISIGPWREGAFFKECEWIDGSPCGKRVV
jgi:hypothetical protein